MHGEILGRGAAMSQRSRAGRAPGPRGRGRHEEVARPVAPAPGSAGGRRRSGKVWRHGSTGAAAGVHGRPPRAPSRHPRGRR